MRDTFTKKLPPQRESDWADDFDRPIPNARGVLTPAEIEALLRPNLPDDLPIEPEPEIIAPRQVPEFDSSTSSQGVSADQSEWADLAARLSLGLGQGAGLKASIKMTDAQTAPHDTLMASLPSAIGAVACFGRAREQAKVLVCLSPDLADALIASACGTQGSTGRIGDAWTLSAIDCALLEQLLGGLAQAFGDDVTLQALDTDVPYMASLLSRRDLTIATYELQAPNLRSDLTLVSSQAADSAELATDAHEGPPVTAVLTARMASLSVPLSRLTNLKAGATLLLGLPPDQPIEVLSGGRDGKVMFEGDVGRKGNKMAVRITRKT